MACKIDPIKFDGFLHRIHGEYEEQGKSMKDLIEEKYGARGLAAFMEFI